MQNYYLIIFFIVKFVRSFNKPSSLKKLNLLGINSLFRLYRVKKFVCSINLTSQTQLIFLIIFSHHNKMFCNGFWNPSLPNHGCHFYFWHHNGQCSSLWKQGGRVEYVCCCFLIRACLEVGMVISSTFLLSLQESCQFCEMTGKMCPLSTYLYSTHINEQV